MPHPPRDDHFYLASRVVFGTLVLVVLPFAYGMMVHPENSAENFAWPIAPRIAAMMFGSMYFSVLYLYTRVAFSRHWHHVALVLWATFPVLAALGAVSLLHWEKFTSDPARLAVWITAYLVFPPCLVVMVVLNRRRDPRVPDAADVHVPIGVRRLSLVFGLVFAALGTALLFAPAGTGALAPVTLKPLAAQAMGCLFLAPAIVQFVMLGEPRWSALRIVTEGAILWFAAMIYSVWRCLDEFDRSRTSFFVFVGFLLLEFAIIVWMYVHFERRLRAQRASTTA